MLVRLSQATAITFLLYLITSMGHFTSSRPISEAATQQPIGLKVLPQPTLETNKPRL